MAARQWSYATALTAASASGSLARSANSPATSAVCSIVGAPSLIHRPRQRSAHRSHSWATRGRNRAAVSSASSTAGAPSKLGGGHSASPFCGRKRLPPSRNHSIRCVGTRRIDSSHRGFRWGGASDSLPPFSGSARRASPEQGERSQIMPFRWAPREEQFPRPPELRIRVTVSRDRHTIYLAGELDVASAPELKAYILMSCA